MKGLLFTYLLTYGGALVALADPFLGLLVYVALAILRPESLWHWAVPPGNYSRIVAIALLLGWLMRGFGNWRFGRAGAILVALLAHLIWASVSAAMAPNQEQAWDFVENLAKIVLPFMVGLTTIESTAQLKQLAWVIVICQGYMAFECNLLYYSTGLNRLQIDGFARMDNNCIAIALVTIVGLAFFLGLETKSWWGKMVAFGCAAVMGHAVMLTMSRGGMLALLITGLVAFLLIPKQPKHYAVFALAVLLGIRLAGEQVREKFSTVFVDAEQRDASAESRLKLWTACAKSMVKHPLFGLGPNHWPSFGSPEYGLKRGLQAHSVWMQMGAEVGVPGLIFLVMFYALCVARLWPFTRRRQTLSDPWFSQCARMVIAALAGFAVSSQFVSMYGLEHPYYITLIGAGVLKLSSVGGLAPAQVSLRPQVWTPQVAAVRYQ